VSLPTVLVTDGHLRPALAAVRSLGRAGYRVHVCSPRRRSLAAASRYAIGHTTVADPLRDQHAFAAAVDRLARSVDAQVLLPVSEESLLAVLPTAEQTPGLNIPFPTIDVFRRASDKAYIMSLALKLGLAVPEQVVLASPDDLDHADVEALAFPIVLKPSRSVAGTRETHVKLGVSYARDRRELAKLVEATHPSAFPLLLQRRIDGPGTGVFLLRWDGCVIARFAHRRIREKPPSGGVSVCCESVALDPLTLRQSETLLSALDWRGPAMVEFKQDRVSGRRYLMEINGRLWGSLQLAIDAGVDFPTLLALAATGTRPTPVTQYAIGVRERWWWGEVDHLIGRLHERSTDGPAPSRVRAAWSFLVNEDRARNEVLRRDDPWPAARETIDWFMRR